MLLFLLALGLYELLDIEGKLKKPLLHLLLLRPLRILFFLVLHAGLIAGFHYHLLLGEDDLQIGLFDFILGEEVDLVDEVQPNCSLKMLAFQ